MVDKISDDRWIIPRFKDDALYLVIPVSYDHLSDMQSFLYPDLPEIFAEIIKKEIMQDNKEYYSIYKKTKQKE